MPTELAPGTVVAEYRIEALLGRGAMAEVYRAYDENLGSVVALKLLDRLSAADDRFRQRFERESTIAASLEHPNVVPVLATGEDDGHLYLAMQLIDGSDLRRLFRESGRLEPERAIAVIEQVAGALDTAHRAGLVHRDVKPGNILVAGERAFICDFGIARHVSSVASLTGDRGFVGTIDYVPPEQIEGGTVDGRADVYSLGCVLYECLAGSRPFERDSELSVVFAHLNEPPPKLSDVRPDLPAAFDDVFATALAKQPNDRYSTCGELADAARAALGGRVLARRKPPRRLLALALTGILVAAAGATALLITRNGRETPVTIAPTQIAGAKLGDSNLLLERMWGTGFQKLSMTEPPNYSVLAQRNRNLSAYFIGTDDHTVEIATSNKADRTAEGIGPCSTVQELKKAYGKSLKPSPNNTHNGVVYAWLLGEHMTFSMNFPNPTAVQTVAIYNNERQWATFNASNNGPCTQATNTTPVKRPAKIPVAPVPALPVRLSTHVFEPWILLRVPRAWSVKTDSRKSFAIRSPSGASLSFVLDPYASTADGRQLRTVSTSARGLTTWVQHRRGLILAGPQTILLGSPVLTATSIDLRARANSVTYLGSRGGPLQARAGRPIRIYLAPVRIGTLAHTLAIVLEASSQRAFGQALPATAAIVKNLETNAFAAANLSALSGFCSVPFNGTCRGELDAGTHSTTTMRPALTYTVPVGWTNSGDLKGFFGLIPPGGDPTAVDIGASDYINVDTSITTGNGRCGDGQGTARTPEAFVEWLRHQPGVAPFTPRPARVGGLSGVVVDLRMRKDFIETCQWSSGSPAQQILTGLPPSPDILNHGLTPGHAVMRLYLLHYKQGTLGIEIDDVRDDARLATYTKVVESFRFGVH
jgi:serine/threonine protein kinase